VRSIGFSKKGNLLGDRFSNEKENCWKGVVNVDACFNYMLGGVFVLLWGFVMGILVNGPLAVIV